MPSVLGEAEEYQLFGHPGNEVKDCNFLIECFNRMEKPVKKVIDLACGTGRHALILARCGYQITGIDLSPAMLTAARQNAAAQGLEVAGRSSVMGG